MILLGTRADNTRDYCRWGCLWNGEVYGKGLVRGEKLLVGTLPGECSVNEKSVWMRENEQSRKLPEKNGERICQT